MPRSSSTVDRLLAPAVRLMASLRFSQKAMLIGASFTLTCGVLTALVLSSSLGELSRAKAARAATTGLRALNDAQIAMQEHRALRARALAKDATATPQALADAAAATDKGLAAFDAWVTKSELRDEELADAAKATHAAWKKAQDTEGEAGPEADTEALRALREEIARLSFKAITSGARDPAMLLAGDVGGQQLPALAAATAEQSVVSMRVLGEGAIWVNDRTALAVNKNMQQYLSGLIGENRKSIERHLPEARELFGKPVAEAFQQMDALNKLIQEKVLDAETPDFSVVEFARQDRAAREAFNRAMTATYATIELAGDRAIASLQRKAFLTLGGVVLALLASAYLFLGFTRGTRHALQRIDAGARAMAAGQFSDKIQVDTHDELNNIGRSLESMAGSLRRFAQAQQEMYEQHEAGEIDARLDAEAFPGAFGVMADQVNTLVEAHIRTKMDAIGIVADYARGDLSRDIARYPGQKARVTEAVDAVKKGMLAVNAEIKALVEAAVEGDFSKRGDAARFEFVYRELIENLNTLMATADQGLHEVGSLLAAMAEGDLTRRVEIDLPGQFGQLASDANRSVEALARIVGEIRQSADSISAAAGEIAAGNADLSMRTEQQAASLEETASSMEELTSTVKQNADNARQANQLAQGAASVAESGGEVVQQVVRTMGDIQTASRRIADIIGVIDGIAFQTNILALNAAVEAARAGEQGRGFAVVAAEVRSLAQRSAGAAKEIKQLITDSVMKVEEGSALVDQAGKTMGEIVGSVKRVTDIMADISAASQEQSSGIEQVNQAITQMDEGTQQNAALVEEASASAESMRQQAEALVEAVAAFRLANGGGAARAAAPRPAAHPAAGKQADSDKIASFEDMIDKHMQWKLRLKTYLRGGGEPLDANTVSVDDACALGKWLYGPGQKVQHLPEFQRLKEHHKHFHAVAGKVVLEHQRGRTAQAQAVLDGEFHDTTQATVTAIRALRDAVEGRRHAPPAVPAPRPAPAATAPMRRAVSATAGDQHWQEF
ncbi:MAG: CZB domain-containing protein [Xanthomonadales bacterium]|nr:CZB domain-containing protein [Xanthomonadales bacterium]MBN8794753.1 CZB domain-containing protein [Stenotrophomonas nitritireducens]